MAEFAYNNAKNTSIGYTPFKLKYGFYLKVSYKEDVDPCSRSKTADQLFNELQTLMSICRENLWHTQELLKYYHDKYAKLRNYTSRNKVWLNSKYIKTKRNRKLKFKFFAPFQVLYPLGKQAYKLELAKK